MTIAVCCGMFVAGFFGYLGCVFFESMPDKSCEIVEEDCTSCVSRRENAVRSDARH